MPSLRPFPTYGLSCPAVAAHGHPMAIAGAATHTAPMTDSPAGPAPEIGEISVSGWYAHTDKMTKVGFLTIARRLPALVSQAVRLAWLASPRDTVIAISL